VEPIRARITPALQRFENGELDREFTGYDKVRFKIREPGFLIRRVVANSEFRPLHLMQLIRGELEIEEYGRS